MCAVFVCARAHVALRVFHLQKATRNINFSLGSLSLPAAAGGLSNATKCSASGRTSPDCFAFCFNTSHNSECSNYSAADEWTAWRDFSPSAVALTRAAPHVPTTVAAFYCGAYPNEFLDPIRHLVLKLTVYGVWFGNFSNVTLEVRPAGAFAGSATYQLHTTVAHLASGFGTNLGALTAWPELPEGGEQALTIPFMVARENLTAPENYGKEVLPLVTEREHSAALWEALPKIPAAPQKITIVQGYHGENDVQAWRDAAQALASFGTTGMGGTASVPLREILEEAGIHAIRHEGSISGNFLPANSSVHSCSPNTVTDHCWGRTDDDVASNLKLWAERLLGPMRLAGVSQFTQFALHDELGWSYPGLWVSAICLKLVHCVCLVAADFSCLCRLTAIVCPAGWTQQRH